MDPTEHYRQLVALGRDAFLAAAAPAALTRFHGGARPPATAVHTLTIDDEPGNETLPHSKVELAEHDLQVLPLVKKPGASFPDRITIGRTSNNDIAIVDHSVSRLHAYLRSTASGWLVADAGSKNGSWLRGNRLEPRREQAIQSRSILRLGDVELTFYLATDLFDVFVGSAR